jgi:hypothetical protein
MEDREAAGSDEVEGCSGDSALPGFPSGSVSGGEPMDEEESFGGTGAVRQPLAEIPLTAIEVRERAGEAVQKRNQKRKRESKRGTWAGEPWLPCFSTDFHAKTCREGM